jgi:hypothetical protein
MGAAVLLNDGSIETAWQMKGLEYGCTLDAVSPVRPSPCHAILVIRELSFTVSLFAVAASAGEQEEGGFGRRAALAG